MVEPSTLATALVVWTALVRSAFASPWWAAVDARPILLTLVSAAVAGIVLYVAGETPPGVHNWAQALFYGFSAATSASGLYTWVSKTQPARKLLRLPPKERPTP